MLATRVLTGNRIDERIAEADQRGWATTGSRISPDPA